MNQKGFINIILAIIVVAFVGGGAYFTLNRQTQKLPTPVIERISPAEASIGAEISIIGSGFTPTKNSLQFGTGFAYINNLVSSDGKTITFTLPESFDTCNPDGSTCAELLSRPFPGQMYEVVVINANGRSNPVNFMVTSSSEPISPTPTPTPIKPSPIQKSGIKGTVIGQYCSGVQPAEPAPDYQSCGEEFLALFSLKIKNNISGIEKQVTTDSTGKFQIELSPGKYTVTQASESKDIIGGPFSIEVKSGAFIEAQLKFQELRP